MAPHFRTLVESLLPQRFVVPPRVLPEYTRGGIGRPDLAFKHAGQPARAFIELKQPATTLAPTRLRGHDADQFRRFKELPIWGFCNFHAMHLYRRGELIDETIVLPAGALDPGTSDAAAERLIRRHDPGPFLDMLQLLASAAPTPPKSASEIAEALAHAARLVRHIVLDQCRAGAPEALADVQAEFRETLFAHARAGGYDSSDENDLFANAFAQTVAFGLLLAREAGGEPVDREAYRRLPPGSYPLLRATLRALMQDEILDILGPGFDVLQDTVNVFDTALLVPRGGRDPILYFYEDFLEVFDPDARRRHGVFFTPVPVVRFMVAATDRALRDAMGTQGLMDPNVLLLDPACGTGTYLIAAAAAVAEQVRATYGEGAVAAEVAALATRLHGLELLVGPYTVAHYRLLREVAAAGAVPTTRLPIYLADTLAPPAGAAGVASRLGFMSAPIVAERQGADTVKRSTRIIAVIGNPPYRRLGEGEEESLVSGWANGFWDDLKAPVREAGWGGELNTFPDLYIAFWRWCLWKLFESDGASGRGVLCLITNRTFLAGHPYAGLRRMLRRRFDTIDIVDLRGDGRGARPAGITHDECVFAIQTGVCVVTAVATGAPRPAGVEARVRYADVWRHGIFSARDKLALLDIATDGENALHFVDVDRSDLADFVPQSFAGLDWASMPQCFDYRGYGVKTQHDRIAYAFSREALVAQIQQFRLEGDPAIAQEMFGNSRKNKAPAAQEAEFRSECIRQINFRPLDRRFLYRHEKFVDEMANRPAAAWGASNVCLYTMPSGIGSGPAVWVHGLLPD